MPASIFYYSIVGALVLPLFGPRCHAFSAYLPDSDTVFLFHLDEAPGTSKVGNEGSASFSGITTDGAGVTVVTAFPISQDIKDRVIRIPPPNPLSDSLMPLDYHFPGDATAAVQSVLDAAFLGDEAAMSRGLSSRLLAELNRSDDLQRALALLGSGMWAVNVLKNAPVNSNNARDVVHLGNASSFRDGSKTFLMARIVCEERQWKIDELPPPPK